MRNNIIVLGGAVVTAVAIATVGFVMFGGDDDENADAQFVGTAASSAPAPEPTTAGPTATKSAKSKGDSVAATGLGPYEIGAKQSALTSKKLLEGTSKQDNCTAAKGTEKYQSPALAFKDGELQRLVITDPSVTTAQGAHVGSTYDEVKKLYPDGQQLDDWYGAVSWYTAQDGNALNFRIADGKVKQIDAGEDEAVRFAYTDGQAC